METFTLSRKELHRPGLLKALCGGRLTNAQVAAALRITVRQVRRLKRRFEAGGPGALVHGNRDRPSPRRLPAAVRDAVVRLMTTVYVGFNDTDRKSTRLNSSHVAISYAVFCLKKKT